MLARHSTARFWRQALRTCPVVKDRAAALPQKCVESFTASPSAIAALKRRALSSSSTFRRFAMRLRHLIINASMGEVIGQLSRKNKVIPFSYCTMSLKTVRGRDVGPTTKSNPRISWHGSMVNILNKVRAFRRRGHREYLTPDLPSYLFNRGHLA